MPLVELDYALIADHAEITGGKLYLMGGGWDTFASQRFPAAVRFAVATGVRIAWEERLREHHASLVSAQGNVYFVNDAGLLRVVKPGEKYDLVAESEVGEKVFASPAMSEGQIFVRGDKSLFCFGNRQASRQTAAK